MNFCIGGVLNFCTDGGQSGPGQRRVGDMGGWPASPTPNAVGWTNWVWSQWWGGAAGGWPANVVPDRCRGGQLWVGQARVMAAGGWECQLGPYQASWLPQCLL